MGETRWLDAGEQRVWRDYLEAVALLERRLAVELDASAHDLVMGEYELLVRLSEAEGHAVRMSDLADDLVHSRSRLTHAIARMESRGLVERRACPGDRRGVLAAMTPAGFAALEAAAPLHVDGVRTHLLDPLGAEGVEQLGRLAATLLVHLRGQGAPAPGACGSGERCADGEAEQVRDGRCPEPDGQLAQSAGQQA